MKILLVVFIAIYLFINGATVSVAQRGREFKDSQSVRDEDKDEKDDESSPLPSASLKPSISPSLTPSPSSSAATPSPSATVSPSPSPSSTHPKKDNTLSSPSPSPSPSPSAEVSRYVGAIESPDPTPKPPEELAGTFVQLPPVAEDTQNAAEILYKQIVVPALSFVSRIDADQLYANESLPPEKAFALTVLGLILLATGVAILKLEYLSNLNWNFFRTGWGKKEVTYVTEV